MAVCYEHEANNKLGMPCPNCTVIEYSIANARLRDEVDRLNTQSDNQILHYNEKWALMYEQAENAEIELEEAKAALAAADDLVAEVVVDRALARNSSDESNDHSPAMRIVREYRALRDASEVNNKEGK